ALRVGQRGHHATRRLLLGRGDQHGEALRCRGGGPRSDRTTSAFAGQCRRARRGALVALDVAAGGYFPSHICAAPMPVSGSGSRLPPGRTAPMAIKDGQPAAATAVGYVGSPTRRITAGNGIEYAYRELGEGDLPLVLLQHFRGNLDNWDPALVDALAADRHIITFDNVGVASTTGTTPNTVEAMAHGAIAFLEAMDFQRVDLLGFSIGSFVAQEIA